MRNAETAAPIRPVSMIVETFMAVVDYDIDERSN